MKAYQFEILLLIAGVEPHYKYVTGLIRMYNTLTADIKSQVNAHIQQGMDITGWREPTYQELCRVHNENVTIDYTIECKNSDHDIVFRVSRMDE